MRRFSILLFILVVCVAIICGCTAPSAPTPHPAAPSAQPASASAPQSVSPVSNGPTKVVHIIASSFDPLILNVPPGTTVTWINEDQMSHRVEHYPVLPSDKLLFRSESLSPGESFSYTFTEPGRYKYGDPQHAGNGDSLVIVG